MLLNNLKIITIFLLMYVFQLGFRVDGRQRLDYRQVVIETGLVSTANGSARVRLARTDVLVTVKMEIEPPSPDQLSHGKLSFFVNWYVTKIGPRALKSLNSV